MAEGEAVREVCLVPVFDRPEFTILCMEHVHKNPDISQIDFVFAVDLRIGGSVHDDLFRVLARFDGSNVGVKFAKAHEYRGNSYNLLTAVQDACDKGYDLIHLLEEDVMVSNDYFRWHREAHKLGDFFATVASKSPRTFPVSGKSLELCYDACDYAPYGVSFNAKQVKEHLLGHLSEAYFSDMIGYVQSNFPHHRFASAFPEQDGLIYRIVTTQNLKCCFPTVPRCYHAGFYGYNRRSSQLKGTLETKIAAIRAILHDKESLNALSWEFPDLEPCNLENPHWYDLRLYKNP